MTEPGAARQRSMSSDKTPDKRIVIIGAGGHAGVVIDTLKALGSFHIHGLVDRDRDTWGATRHGCKVLGGDDVLSSIRIAGVRQAFLGLGMIQPSSLRKTCAALTAKIGFKFPTLVHPTAWVSPSATLGDGTFIGPLAVVNSSAVIGEHVIINSGAIVEHDCQVGSFSHVASGACLAGGVVVGAETLIGARAVVRQGLEIGYRVLVGAGAVVVKSVPNQTQALGVPAQFKPCRYE
jgi:UDP-perosamine 4-acetyltransferase